MPIPEFDDIIFEKLNKEYGAYLLRIRYNRVVVTSIMLLLVARALESQPIGAVLSSTNNSES